MRKPKLKWLVAVLPLMAVALVFFSAARLLFWPDAAYADPSPSYVTTSQVSCASTATLLVAAQPAQLSVITIEQGGSTAFYLGGLPAVTTSTGFLVPGTAGTSFTVSFSGPLYCITSSGTATVYVIQTVKGG